MSDIFASPKHPSLFPNVIPCPDISPKEYHLFYKHERHLFTVSLVVLHREAVQSVLVMGFLLWLEREGYTSNNLAEFIVSSFLPDTIYQIFDQIVICLKFMEKKGNNFMSSGYDIMILQGLLDRKSIDLEELYINRDQIFDEVSVIANGLSGKAFDDILQHFIWSNGPWVLPSPAVGGGAGDYIYIGPIVPFPSYDISKYVEFLLTTGFGGANYDAESMQNHVLSHHCQHMVDFGGANNGFVTPMIGFRLHKDLGMNQWHAFHHAPSVIRDQEQDVTPDDRTIFLTFSKGYPICEREIKDYFTRMFGDFIETIYMHEVGPDEQPLYARIVARSLSMASAVINRDGADGKSKYYINGKHVWARKFVKRTPATIVAEVATPPQP